MVRFSHPVNLKRKICNNLLYTTDTENLHNVGCNIQLTQLGFTWPVVCWRSG